MHALDAGSPFPKTELPRLGGGTMTLGAPDGGRDWQLVVIYRGLHCPLCKTYLAELDQMQTAFHKIGVDVVTASGDPEAKAQMMVDEKELTLPMGYGLSVEQMRTLGLYVSDPRSRQETDRPFGEPGLFVINAEGRIQMVDISNAPFLRPPLASVLKGITFTRKNDYPIRGTHMTA
ncbi:redoxin domain-containing protein [uncultured Tateyamaria sp.]|uniref:redoxin domain-containing protein n=1 Tax=uncultured Tateyamaria sp. TaxID=455651 RepID=UPI0026126998|nr:redoxin domain-containing protein [uncultured Tateyamaria sp.]